MNLFEFFYVACYLSMLTILIVVIQVYNPGKQIREVLAAPETTEVTKEEEEFEMTENPMFRESDTEGLRHRNVETKEPVVEQVD